MRKPVFAANWKMNKTSQEAEVFINSFLNNPLPKDAEIVVCSTATSLPILSKCLKEEKNNIGLGAQNFYPAKEGAFTGEVSPAMIDELGVQYVIIGHSERRAYFAEDDAFINKKVKTAFEWNFVPILCCGEDLTERELGVTNEKVAMQIKKGLAGLTDEEIKKVIIAYEPIWAIGTGVSASDKDAVTVIDMIRVTLDEIAGTKVSDDVRVLYGGSMKAENVKTYMAHKTIDGGLIGGASLKPDTFRELIENGVEARNK